jgi:3-deoxy-manno-octulosonate cytidylyltransferase (CMP-KDO synthetase)
MILAIIPARWHSSRFPGKPLADIGGKSMIQRVYEQVSYAKTVQEIAVATDDQRILDHVREFGGLAHLTSSRHLTGTDRCAELAKKFPKARIVVNVQGDEPFIQPEQIDLLTDLLGSAGNGFPIATLAKKIVEPAHLSSPNVVKVVFSEKTGALYFSRNPIPHLRGTPQERWLEAQDYFKHIGLYAFKRQALLRIAQLSPTPLERAESLEQLRWLENGYRIAVGVTEKETIGIDTPEDLEAARAFI